MPEFGFVIDVSADLDGLLKRVGYIERTLRDKVIAEALTRTAMDIKDAEVAEMSRVFDRPTRFTLNALYVRGAKSSDLVAGVYFKEGFGSIPAWRYLGPQVEGGGRNKKSHERRLERAGVLKADEYCVPGAQMKTDSFGNVPGSEIERILSQLQAAGGSGYSANETSRSRKRNKGRVQSRYFVMRGRRVPDGIYQRNLKSGRIIPALLFVRAPRYQKRLAFYDVAKRTFDARFSYQFSRAWRHHVLDAPARAA